MVVGGSVGMVIGGSGVVGVGAVKVTPVFEVHCVVLDVAPGVVTAPVAESANAGAAVATSVKAVKAADENVIIFS